VLSTVVLTCAEANASAGELLILESTTPALRSGEVTETGSVLDVPRNIAVALVALSGGVLRIEGP